jgi:DNA-binding NtrC family response regulator
MPQPRNPKPLVYIIEDEEKMREIFRINLAGRYSIACFASAEEAFEGIGRARPALIVTDVRLPGMDGIEFMSKAKERLGNIPFIVFTGYGSIGHAVETMKRGAFDYLVKPVRIENLVQSIDRALSYLEVSASPLENGEAVTVSAANLRQEFITRDPSTEQMLRLAQKAARFDAPILITGETGTGKGLIARYVHEKSGRKGPFVQLNCASIPRDLLEGELFGYKKGAFTGAVQDYIGKIAHSDGGTLFLDEIGELPLETQVKLLNVLELPEYYPIGSNVKKKIDLHLIAAANRNLRKMVDVGEFRQDLYYRVAVIPLVITPLRERKCDILPIADFFLGLKGPNCRLSSEAKLRLLAHNWPGNVRELKNVIERSMLLSERENTLETLVFDGEEEGKTPSPAVGTGSTEEIPETWEEFKAFKSAGVRERREELEKRFIENLLLKHGGNISVSARSARMDRRQFQEMIKALNVDVLVYKKRGPTVKKGNNLT